MEDKITLELSEDEILMLQELVKLRYGEPMRAWERKILSSLDKKASEAYEKPVMSKEERDGLISAEREQWSRLCDATMGSHMALAKRTELDFYFKTEEGEADDTNITGNSDKAVPVTGEV